MDVKCGGRIEEEGRKGGGTAWGGGVDLKSMDLNNKARRNQYFIEWRVKDPSIKKGMEELQNKIRPIDPNILMDQVRYT
eukprot:1395085-Amorphochlora_amoeboformis.AAC.1